MEKYKLKNGLTLIYEETNSKSVAMEVMVEVGSNHEPLKILGVSHFLEHMLFEGTKKRKNSKEITREIDRFGGYFNAYTTTDRTAYHIKGLTKQFDKILEVMGDIFQNSLFTKKTIDKEKQVILKEIHMVLDDPRFYQWVLFQKSLFKSHPAKNPTYGTLSSVKNMDQSDILSHFNKYYVPSNMVISVVGRVPNVREKVETIFKNMGAGSVNVERFNQVKDVEPLSVLENRKTLSSYLVHGYKIPSRLEMESYVVDVIAAILGKGQSGWMFDEIRNKRGLSYEVGVNCDSALDHGYFAVQASVNKSKVEITQKIILTVLKKLQKVNNTDLEEAKGYIEGSFALENEDSIKYADQLCFWELAGDARLAEEYLNKIQRITKRDVQKVAKEYLNENFTRVLIEPE